MFFVLVLKELCLWRHERGEFVWFLTCCFVVVVQVGRMLLLSRESQQRAAAAAASEGRPCPVASMAASPFTRVTRFVPSSHKIVQFSEGQPEVTPKQRKQMKQEEEVKALRY
jgi:hypothetical protein